MEHSYPLVRDEVSDRDGPHDGATPAWAKRTVGSHLVQQLDGVLVDSALINRPLLELFQWDGKEPIPTEIWQRVAPSTRRRSGDDRGSSS